MPISASKCVANPRLEIFRLVVHPCPRLFPCGIFFFINAVLFDEVFFFERNIIVPGKRNGLKNWNTLNPNVLLLSSFEKYSRLNLINLIKSEK